MAESTSRPSPMVPQSPGLSPPSTWDCSCPLHRRRLLESLNPPARNRGRLVASCSFISNYRPPDDPIPQFTKRTSRRVYSVCRRSQAEEIVMTAPEPTMHGAPRRYVSGVRMECKPVPWRYSSSVHLKLNSTKKRYTEKVFYKMRLVPFGYFEGATADFCHEANPGARRYIATMTLQCTNAQVLALKQPRPSAGASSDSEDATDV